jgi:hypothetical protein
MNKNAETAFFRFFLMNEHAEIAVFTLYYENMQMAQL